MSELVDRRQQEVTWRGPRERSGPSQNRCCICCLACIACIICCSSFTSPLPQVAVAQTAKCDAQVRVEKVESRERGLEERGLLQGELDKRCEDVLMARREGGWKLAEVTEELAEKTEEAASAGRREEMVKEEAKQQISRAEQLASKLREAR